MLGLKVLYTPAIFKKVVEGRDTWQQKCLNEDDAHGYRIVQEIKDRSDGRLIIKEGSLYPILYKLSDEGYIISQEDISETKLGRKRIRVIYSITPKGREHLIQLKEEYDIVHDSIRCIFERSKSL